MPLPKHGRGRDVIGQCHLMWHLYKAIKNTRPDIIHAITIRYAFYTGIIARLMGYKPVIFTVAGLGSLYTAPGLKAKILRSVLLPFMRFAFGGNGKHIIFQNPDDQEKMTSTNIIPVERSTIIRGSGVNLKEFPYAPYVAGTNPPVVLFSSRLMQEKGIRDFIEAARILKVKNIEARFQVAGNVYEDNARSMSRAEMQKFHDDGIIEWLGQCHDMPDLLNRSKIMVLPSYYGEGVPKALLEAASIGRPIVTCDTPGCREAVEHKVNGLLVSPQSPTDLADAIETLLNDSVLCEQYGAAGRKRMEEDFHVDAVVEQTMKIYDTILQDTRLDGFRR
jgi:glycosyltransferase involved in cell wall biosynthesis